MNTSGRGVGNTALRRHGPRGALLLAVCGAALAQEHSRADLQAELTRLQALVQACGQTAAGCVAGMAPEDEIVAAQGPQPKFTLRWDWLREALEEAKSAAPQDRLAAMQRSEARLEELAQEAGSSDGDGRAAEFARARTAADGVLRRAEFGAAAPPSAWDRFKARVARFVYELFDGVGRLGAQAPWLATVLEWGFFLAAAVGVLLLFRRNFQRGRLQANLRGGEAAQAGWGREATDWAAMGERSAAQGEWREAVHCLYWAAIVRMEGRRAWRHNPARTPREYLRLLKPGSPQHEFLGSLTGLLERVWYGLRPAGREDYERARSWLERLGDGSNRAGGDATAPAPARSERA